MKPNRTLDVIDRLAEEKKGAKGNFTFRLPPILVSNFKELCKKRGLSMSEAIEALLREATKGR